MIAMIDSSSSRERDMHASKILFKGHVVYWIWVINKWRCLSCQCL